MSVSNFLSTKCFTVSLASSPVHIPSEWSPYTYADSRKLRRSALQVLYLALCGFFVKSGFPHRLGHVALRLFDCRVEGQFFHRWVQCGSRNFHRPYDVSALQMVRTVPLHIGRVEGQIRGLHWRTSSLALSSFLSCLHDEFSQQSFVVVLFSMLSFLSHVVGGLRFSLRKVVCSICFVIVITLSVFTVLS